MIKNNLKKLKKLKIGYFSQLKYSKYYNKLELNEKQILLESDHGSKVNGNIFYFLKELNNDAYASYKILLSVSPKSKKKIKNILQNYNLNNIILVKNNSKEFFKALATSKYLINDTSFLPYFVKKEGQVYINTWHGTPLKTLGRKVKNDYKNIGNIQKNFVCSDYLLYPNEFTMNIMLDDYMIRNLTDSKILLEGYPRNSAFLSLDNNEEIKEKYDLNNKQIIVYMPTWRGTVKDRNKRIQKSRLTKIFDVMEEKLNDKQIMYVNLHPMEEASVNFSKYSKIKLFPKEYETYDFLKIADVLVTDYSSVFFDFAPINKKIIIFAYDKDEYLKDRGLYFPIEELPFPFVYNEEDLIKEIDKPIQYDTTKFIQKFCKYDSIDVTKRICEKIILGKDVPLNIIDIEKNNKKNIFIYAGNLKKNGMTISVGRLLEFVDKEKYNYYLLYTSSDLYCTDIEFSNLTNKINYYAYSGKMNADILSKICIKLFNKNLLGFEKFLKITDSDYDLEFKRIFNNINVSNVIHFTGYGTKISLLLSKFKCNKIIFAHNDMKEEAKNKAFVNEKLLRHIYKNFDKIAIVTEDLRKSTEYFLDKNDYNKVNVINNIIDYKNIIEKSKLPIEFQNETISNVSKEQLEVILNKRNKKFITIGRFSNEKGHFRLINSFDRLWEKDNSIYLIIIGGYGNLFEKTIKYASTKKSKNNIIIIKSVDNPYPILKKCNYFVLSSFYEGFGLVLAEANILNLPVISTDIVGPRLFMKKYGGFLTENNEDGIYKGMKKMMKNEIPVVKIDYEMYNKGIIDNYNKLLK